MPEAVALAPWGAFFATWWVWSWRATPPARSETRTSRGIHLALLGLSFFLLGARLLGLGPLSARSYPEALPVAVSGLALQVIGLAFAIWARAALGANWSLDVSVKHGHELVRTGPYGIVRHPIYTGLLTMFLGTAIIFGTVSALAGTLLMAGAYLRKIRLEERWMREEFGADYDGYAARVRSLVPYLF